MRKAMKRIGVATLLPLLLWASSAAKAGPGGDMERLINQDQLACSGTLVGSLDNLENLLRSWEDARLDCSGNAAPSHATTLRNLMGLRWMLTSVSHEVTMVPSSNGRSTAMVTMLLVLQRNLFSQGLR